VKGDALINEQSCDNVVAGRPIIVTDGDWWLCTVGGMMTDRNTLSIRRKRCTRATSPPTNPTRAPWYWITPSPWKMSPAYWKKLGTFFLLSDLKLIKDERKILKSQRRDGKTARVNTTRQLWCFVMGNEYKRENETLLPLMLLIPPPPPPLSSLRHQMGNCNYIATVCLTVLAYTRLSL
jgi:hypothetical protein